MTSSTGRPRTPAAQRLVEQRAAAAAERARAAARRRRLQVVGSVAGTLLLIVAVLVVVKLTVGSRTPVSGAQATEAGSSVLDKVTHVPASVLDEIGAGTSTNAPHSITAPALTAGGKPRVLYVGAEYCPYCAAQRWAIVVALSRFGTFTGLGQTASTPNDTYPNTPTLSFHGSTYTSSYLSFTAVEMQSNQVVNGKYATLDTLTAADKAIYDKYNAKPYVDSANSIPFLDLGGRYVSSGASYLPSVLAGKTHAEVAAALSDQSSAIAQGADGTANVLTAALCTLTGNAPAAVCTASGVTTAASALHGH